MVFELGARMQHGVIVRELDVAGLQHHVEPKARVMNERVEQVQCLDLDARQGQAANVMAQFDVLAQVSAAQAARARLSHADQLDHIGRVGVVGQVGIGRPT
jgi:hypothetical protein